MADEPGFLENLQKIRGNDAETALATNQHDFTELHIRVRGIMLDRQDKPISEFSYILARIKTHQSRRFRGVLVAAQPHHQRSDRVDPVEANPAPDDKATYGRRI